MKKISPTHLAHFQQTIWDYYTKHGRQFPWRNVDDPYQIVVSEIMLQQTQTHRVEQKFNEFMTKFPNFSALAQAPTRDVLIAWQGLGYNRRALALHAIAQLVVKEFNGLLPASAAMLATFPHIGPNTAGSICAFAFNQPTVFVETNIRAVFIHFFFSNAKKVHDKDLLPLVRKTVDEKNPRHWYYALMDYGVMLKKMHKNPARKSAHHTRQSTFEGSHRQIRGMILKLLTTHACMNQEELYKNIDRDAQRTQAALAELLHEGFLEKNGTTYSIVV